MEAEEIVKLTCHRLATEDELQMAELMKRPAGGAQFSHPSSAKSSGMATPRRGIQIQDPQSSTAAATVQLPPNPRPIGSAQTRPNSTARGTAEHETDLTEHCTSQ